MSEREEKMDLQGEITEPLRGRLVRDRLDYRPGLGSASRSLPALGSVARMRKRGTMRWFNSAKDLGGLRTDDGEWIEVPGAAFAPGEKPVARCAGKAIEFESLDGTVSGIAFVPELEQRRARRRRR
jgi:hypothetical protein